MSMSVEGTICDAKVSFDPVAFRALLKSHGVTLLDFSHTAGLTDNTHLSRLLSRESPVVSVETWQKFCAAGEILEIPLTLSTDFPAEWWEST